MRIEWNTEKDQRNRRVHGLSFGQAERLFTSGVEYLEIFDEAHSIAEDRFLCIGPISRGVVVVVMTEPDEDTIRIISARIATKQEAARYRDYFTGENE